MTIVITGAGPIGSTVARQYADAGMAVRMLTRSGSGPDSPLIDRQRVDVTDRAALEKAVQGANVIHHCIHASAYTVKTWERELPAAEQIVLEVAAAAGATVVFPESLYSFDTDSTITETTRRSGRTGMPAIRARLLDARKASRTRTVSVVASDYFGPGSGANAHAGDRMVEPAVHGRTVRPLGRVDLPHSWTYLPDLAAAMIRAAEQAESMPVGGDRLLFAPTPKPRSQREMADAYAAAAGRGPAKVSPVPAAVLRMLGWVQPGARGLADMSFLLTRALVMDSTASEAKLGLSPTPWDEAIAATVADYRTR